MDAFTPQQTIELVSRIGTKKAHMRLDKLWWNAFMTGPLLGFGCAVLVSTNAAPWYQENAPGLIRTIGALMFPVGLVMIVLSGSDLFTSNIMFMPLLLLTTPSWTAFLHRRITILDVAKNWAVSFLGNLAGSLFFMAIITGYGGVFEESPAYSNAAITLATQKAKNPEWHQIFLRAIGANWLVCFAVFISISSRDISSKIIAIWWPTATFVALALDHVVANMFFIPLGIWCGADIGVGYYIWKSMIPTALGNMVGGGLFVGTAYWYLYLTGETGVGIDFNIGSLASAMEAGGPMRSGKSTHLKKHSNEPSVKSDGQVIEGQDPNRNAAQLLNSGGMMASALGKELSDTSPYAKTHAERMKSQSDDEEKNTSN